MPQHIQRQATRQRADFAGSLRDGSYLRQGGVAKALWCARHHGAFRSFPWRKSDPAKRVAHSRPDPKTWNWALIAPAGRAMPGALAQAPGFTVTLGRLREAVMVVALAEPRAELAAEQASGNSLHFRSRSRVLGLPDLIWVRLVETAPGRVSLAIFSWARFGLYDFGVNRRRALRWLGAVEAQLTPQS